MFFLKKKSTDIAARQDLNNLFEVTPLNFFYDYVFPVLRDLFELKCRNHPYISSLLKGDDLTVSSILFDWLNIVRKNIPTVNDFKQADDKRLCQLVARNGGNVDRKLSQAMEALIDEDSVQLQELKQKFGVYFSLYRLCRQLSIYIEAYNGHVEKTLVGSTKQIFRAGGAAVTKAMRQVMDRDIKMDFLWIVIKHLTGIQPCTGSFLEHVQQHSAIDSVRTNPTAYFNALNEGENIDKTRNFLDDQTLSLFYVDQHDVTVQENRSALMDAIDFDEQNGAVCVTVSLPGRVSEGELDSIPQEEDSSSSSEKDMSNQTSVLGRQGSFYEPEEKKEREVHKVDYDSDSEGNDYSLI